MTRGSSLISELEVLHFHSAHKPINFPRTPNILHEPGTHRLWVCSWKLWLEHILIYVSEAANSSVHSKALGGESYCSSLPPSHRSKNGVVIGNPAAESGKPSLIYPCSLLQLQLLSLSVMRAGLSLVAKRLHGGLRIRLIVHLNRVSARQRYGRKSRTQI